MTSERDVSNPGNAEVPAANNPIHIAEQLADSLWRITETWSDFARTTVAIPLTRAMDDIGLQLRLTLGRTPIKQHLQHIANARRALIPVEYYLLRAHERGLVEAGQVEQLRSRVIDLAQRLDQHRTSIIQSANQKIAKEKQRQEKNAKAIQGENNADVKTETTVAH